MAQVERERKQNDDDMQRKSKRQAKTPDQNSSIFCLKSEGKLHDCFTVSLDTQLRKMATELHDAALLARIWKEILIAIEANQLFP